MQKVTKQLLTTAIFFTLFFLPKEGMSQKATDNGFRDATFSCINKSKYIWVPQGENWVDRKTGKIVSSQIVGEAHESAKRDINDPNRAFDSQTGQNFFWDDKTKTWKDAKTGKSVTAINLRDALFCCLNKSKYIWEPQGENWVDRKTGKIVSSQIVGEAHESAKRDISDPNRAYDSKTGQNFFWDDKIKAWRDSKTGECICPKCPPTSTAVKDSAKRTSLKDFPHKDIFIGFSLIREDNGSNGFNTYGGELAYTRNLCGRGGITGDVGVNFGSYGMVDYTKINILAGGTYYPIKTAVPASDFSFSVHALAGLSNIKSSYGSGSYSSSSSNSYFTMDIGGGFNYYFGDKTGVGLRIGYMPTFSKGNTSNNFRVAIGIDFR